MTWESFRLGTHYSHVKHKKCLGHVLRLAYGWLCSKCRWTLTYVQMDRKGSDWYMENFEGKIDPDDRGTRLVWVQKEGSRYTSEIWTKALLPDGKLIGGGTWEPYVD